MNWNLQEVDMLTPTLDNMTKLPSDHESLEARKATLEKEVDNLKEQIAALRLELEGRTVFGSNRQLLAQQAVPSTSPSQPPSFSAPPPPSPSASVSAALRPPPPSPAVPRAPPRHGLSRAQVERYSRHLLLPSFGVAAQERLTRGSVLVVGCGGLGSPVAMYLAAAGVGRLGLVDHDSVDVTNLHRQVMHATSRVGMPKVQSARLTCGAINPTIQIEAHTTGFAPSNALALTDSYDVVVDASDNPATRYLVSDACVVSNKPLVSAAAVGTDGQLTVYHYGEDGPCYRCLFPESPAPENCSRCGEAGVLGVVPGVMGCLQAVEAIKILAEVGEVAARKLTLFDALAGRFMNVRLRGRNPACVACGTSPTITRATLPSYDYVLFTGQPPDDGPPEELQLLDPLVRLEPADVARMLAAGAGPAYTASQAEAVEARTAAVLLDVRPQTQYDIFALPGVVHVPYERLDERLAEVVALCGGMAPSTAPARTGQGDVASTCGADEATTHSVSSTAAAAAGTAGLAGADPATLTGADGDRGGGSGRGSGAGGAGTGGGAEGHGAATVSGEPPPAPAPTEVVVLCRRGNNSQRVVARLAQMGVAARVTDMRGGYQAWAREVDPAMPLL